MTVNAGLPQVALDRIARARASGVRTSLLSVPSAASARSVGLNPVGEVMGCIVQHLGWQGWAGCGYWGNNYRQARVTTFGSYAPYVDSVRHGYDTALQRLATEATMLGADGVMDVRITVTHLGNDNHEFVALGSAVRLGQERSGADAVPKVLATPFLTDLSGADVCKLMRNGWIPTSIVYGIALAVRHDDWQTYAQSRSWVNTEVSGFTELTNLVRHQARQKVTAHAAAKAAEGVLITGSSMRVWEQEPSDGHRDHLAEARMFGTGIVAFARPGVKPRPTSLSFLPLR
ncbi:Putative heavy-metal-binding [Nakamurella panacisegetis]|uniref:Putative heavy-metal-binding n=1 Tax=Nakamurella panacisegetis TaxID=1090615 RepID=A0A1H0MGM6_9ACTN|nr:heavy metal-binding domain-containing protein [Nakamurella panacisegetis]SDO79300.1 Putative heavy-metal-binding [Nakamurella panacisegetis]